MNYEQIEKVNKTIQTTDIKGKDYAEVNQRIKAFRMLVPNGTIETEILSNNNGVCVIKATIKDEEGKTLATGHAYEKEGSTFINKTSYIENCETSAVGRALGMLGIGIDTSVASYEEVANAIKQQGTEKEPLDQLLLDKCQELNIDLNRVATYYGKKLEDLENADLTKAIAKKQGHKVA